jgi:hypothetical protein
MSAPVTEAHRKLVAAIIRDLSIDDGAQLIADSEAKACDQLRADRTYNHECINRLATATGTLGEKSEKVVEVALSTIAELRAERARLDYLSTLGFEHRHHETGDHLGHEWTISSYGESEDVTLRDVIDAEMREDAK